MEGDVGAQQAGRFLHPFTRLEHRWAADEPFALESQRISPAHNSDTLEPGAFWRIIRTSKQGSITKSCSPCEWMAPSRLAPRLAATLAASGVDDGEIEPSPAPASPSI
jgi:hypothetical protein